VLRMTKRILIADDSISSRGMVSIVLRGSGFECVEASDGQQALDLLLSEKFDLLITDHWMPSMTGLELVKIVREKPAVAGLPIIAMTTDVDVAKSSELRNVGVTACLNKPFSRDELVATVTRVLG